MNAEESKYAILVVDDEPANLQKLERTFFGQYTVYQAASGEEAFELVRTLDVDLVITDQKMPRMSGVDLLKRVLKIKPEVMRIILTGYTEVEDLIEAINEGHVYRYITKPWDPKELRVIVRQALEKLKLERENRRLTAELARANERLRTENLVLRNEVRRHGDSDRIIFHSPVMDDVLRAASRVAQVDSTVLITGETGTGKEMVARHIHAQSPRASGNFVAVNCGAIPRELVESEFFGYRRGAFSGAAGDKKGYFQVASGGTIFLDEVGEAPLELQVKLLRVLQDQEIWPVGAEKAVRVDVRVIASTNRDLARQVATGEFREDLFFRLNVFSIRVPPLRERLEDIPPLVEYFSQRFQEKLNRRLGEIDPGVLKVFQSYNWPGNVRQLENELERLVLLTEEGGEMRAGQISPYILGVAGQEPMPEEGETEPLPLDGGNLDIRDNLQRLEQRLIQAALDRNDANRTHAARTLGITRQSLLERMKRYGIE